MHKNVCRLSFAQRSPDLSLDLNGREEQGREGREGTKGEDRGGIVPYR